MAKKTKKTKLGPRTPWAQIKCLMCPVKFLATRQDAVCCSPKCRKQLSRRLRENDKLIAQVFPEPPRGQRGDPKPRKRREKDA